jgi:hypothetical protein
MCPETNSLKIPLITSYMLVTDNKMKSNPQTLAAILDSPPAIAGPMLHYFCPKPSKPALGIVTPRDYSGVSYSSPKTEPGAAGSKAFASSDGGIAPQIEAAGIV